MRHRKKFNALGRKTQHRNLMLANMACSLIQHKRITTTVAKAKALRIYVEPLITKSKDDTTHSRRVVFSYLRNKEAVSELFREVSPKVGERPGGYTRILKTGSRQGDQAEMCMIELVDFNELYTTERKAKKKTRRRGGAKPAAAPATEAPKAEEPKAEAAADEAVAETPEAKAQVAEKAAPEAPADEKADDAADAKSEGDSDDEEKSA